MGIFKKKIVEKSYDREHMKPVICASICTGEQVAGFKDIQTGKLEEIMLIKSPKDLDDFKNIYGITEKIEKEYWMLDEDVYAEIRMPDASEMNDIGKRLFAAVQTLAPKTDSRNQRRLD